MTNYLRILPLAGMVLVMFFFGGTYYGKILPATCPSTGSKGNPDGAVIQRRYTAANAHSHNDYEQERPFTAAYEAGFGSIEADIFLSHDSLIVGHAVEDLRLKRTLQNLYLDPLLKKVIGNNGYPYADSSLSLQLLIDIKTGADSTLKQLTRVLEQYPVLTGASRVQFVITGNRPQPADFEVYPPYLRFDGEFQKKYPAGALKRVALFSDDLKRYTRWDGHARIPPADRKVIDSLIAGAHRLHKKVRFWDAPDFRHAWTELMHEDIDYINTDHIGELKAFLDR